MIITRSVMATDIVVITLRVMPNRDHHAERDCYFKSQTAIITPSVIAT